MKRILDARGQLYFWIAVASVWAGELGNLSGADLFTRIHDRWPVLAISSVLAGLVAVRAYLDQHISRNGKQ